MLGPLQVEGPHGPVIIGSARQRRLLVALATNPGRVLGTGLLVELVWSAPPADPLGSLQTNVSRLRRVLPSGLRIETAADSRSVNAVTSTADLGALSR